MLPAVFSTLIIALTVLSVSPQELSPNCRGRLQGFLRD
jgi:hypothetical protein